MQRIRLRSHRTGDIDRYRVNAAQYNKFSAVKNLQLPVSE